MKSILLLLLLPILSFGQLYNEVDWEGDAQFFRGQTTTQRDAFSGTANGYFLFNSTSGHMEFYNTGWVTLLDSSDNLSSLSDSSVARTNLGLGNSAVLDIGTASGTVAAGDDSRIINSVQTSGDQTIAGTKTFEMELVFKEIAEPTSPVAGYQSVYVDTADNRLKRKQSDGTVSVIGEGGGGSAFVAKLASNITQNVPSSTTILNSTLVYNSTEIDTHSAVDLVANTITIPFSMRAMVTVQTNFQDSTSRAGYREVGIKKNGTVIAFNRVDASQAMPFGYLDIPTQIFTFQSGDVITAAASQNSGTTLNANTSSVGSTFFQVVQIQ